MVNVRDIGSYFKFGGEVYLGYFLEGGVGFFGGGGVNFSVDFLLLGILFEGRGFSFFLYF